MPFIIQGKTNWLFIVIVAILAILISSGVLFYINQVTKETVSLTSIPEIKIPEKKIQNSIPAEFNVVGLVSNNLPDSIEFWTEAYCPNQGSDFDYKVPLGYKVKSCVYGDVGSHGGCYSCIMTKIKLVKGENATSSEGMNTQKNTNSQDQLLFKKCSELSEKYLKHNKYLNVLDVLEIKKEGKIYLAGSCSRDYEDVNMGNILFIVKKNGNNLESLYDEQVTGRIPGDTFESLLKDNINNTEEFVWITGHYGGAGGVADHGINIYDLEELKSFSLWCSLYFSYHDSMDDKDVYEKYCGNSKDLDLEKYKAYKDYSINFLKQQYEIDFSLSKEEIKPNF